jgi:hypothetical protein
MYLLASLFYEVAQLLAYRIFIKINMMAPFYPIQNETIFLQDFDYFFWRKRRNIAHASTVR